MNEIQIFNSDESERIKSIEDTARDSFFGFIYFLEYGENIKIGYSQNPSSRIKQLRKQAEYGEIKLGNVAISKPHTNYRENEKLLHQYFNQNRISGTELFSITLKQILSDLPKDLKFLDESKELAQESEQGFEALKRTFSKFWGIESEISYMQEQQKKSNNPQGVKRIHVYKDRNGTVLAEKHITKLPDGEKKTYWYSINPKTGRKTTGLNGMKMPLYHAEKLRANKSPLVCRGRKRRGNA